MPDLYKHDCIMPKRVPGVQVSDTTVDDSSNAAGIIKIKLCNKRIHTANPEAEKGLRVGKLN